VSLPTKDGVWLSLSYYPSLELKGSEKAKQVAPILLMHDFKGTRANMGALARRLQSPAEGEPERPSFAVISVDLRGHGDSARRVLPNGAQQQLDPARLGPADMAAMVGLDLEAVRHWMVGKNDEGEFNLNKLGVVGAGMGASVAANWAGQDWAMPPLATGKQGQDVQALVLISPRWTYRGLSMQPPLQLITLKQNVAWLLVYGAEDVDARADARRIHQQLERFHPAGNEPEEIGSLIAVGWPTSLQGGQLLATQTREQIEERIIGFLVARLAERKIPWTARRQHVP
jgi:pimeloyl-ACP methyl ester carboxylesterase